jgi:hypothetical protein
MCILFDTDCTVSRTGSIISMNGGISAGFPAGRSWGGRPNTKGWKAHWPQTVGDAAEFQRQVLLSFGTIIEDVILTDNGLSKYNSDDGTTGVHLQSVGGVFTPILANAHRKRRELRKWHQKKVLTGVNPFIS